MRTLRISALALFSAVALAACDRDGGTGPTGLREGQFEGDIRGDLDIRLEGDAESGYGFTPSEIDVIILTDYARNVEIGLYTDDGEFPEGTRSIEDEEDLDSRIVGYVADLETGETFGSVSGTLDIDDVSSSGEVEGSARFTAESDDVPGSFITVDVIFNTEYTGAINFSLSPSLSRVQKR